jgi:hypothetical protein
MVAEDVTNRWKRLTVAQVSLLLLFLYAWPLFRLVKRYFGGLTVPGGLVIAIWAGLFVLAG